MWPPSDPHNFNPHYIHVHSISSFVIFRFNSLCLTFHPVQLLRNGFEWDVRLGKGMVSFCVTVVVRFLRFGAVRP